VNNEVSSNDDVVLYGHFKDESSYYLQMFPEWTLRSVNNFKAINATDIRRSLFESGVISAYSCLPETTQRFLKQFKGTQRYHDLVEEWEFFAGEAEKYRDYPYPQTLGLMCSDALVVCQGFILLVQRKFAPGKGVWALPGGFKESRESFQDCCIRELREETRLKVPVKVLAGSIRGQHMFDSPDRSLGVPRVTMAYHIEIAPNNDGSLPEVRAQSDAYKVKWVSFADTRNMNLFDDHSDIVEYFL
jgi:bifunctional NMN adenylyltransferase/nudix hydrolase